MGIAAYNRGSQAISDSIHRDNPIKPCAFDIMDRVNSLPKYPGACKPFAEKLTITRSHGVFWLSDYDNPEKSSRWYNSLSDAIRSWEIFLTEYCQSSDTWVAIIISEEC